MFKWVLRMSEGITWSNQKTLNQGAIRAGVVQGV